MKKQTMLDPIRNNIPLSDISDTVEDQSHINEEGNDYEEIDESVILREPITISNTSSSSTYNSKDDSVTGGTDNDGYLHPYHSLYSSDIMQENNEEKKNMNIIDCNIHRNVHFPVSDKHKKFGSTHKEFVSKADNIYLEVIDKENSEEELDEDDQKADCNKVVFFLWQLTIMPSQNKSSIEPNRTPSSIKKWVNIVIKKNILLTAYSASIESVGFYL